MSKMEELYAKVAADSILQEKYQKTLTDVSLPATKEDLDVAALEKQTLDVMIRFAKEQGFEVTGEEIKEFFSEKAALQNTELSAAELDAVAGGKTAGGYACFQSFSIATFVIGCIVASVDATNAGSNCNDYFDQQALNQM